MMLDNHLFTLNMGEMKLGEVGLWEEVMESSKVVFSKTVEFKELNERAVAAI